MNRFVYLPPVVLVLGFLSACCQSSLPPIPTEDDILVSSYEDGCNNLVFTLSSSGKGENPSEDLGILGDYAEWSPNGLWILSIRDGYQRLALTDAVSGQFIGDLIEMPGGIRDASWDPSSSKILYTTNGDEIGWMDVSCIQRGEDCKPEKHILYEGFSPDWSPDGNSIAFAGSDWSLTPSHIYVSNLDEPSNSIDITPSLEDCLDPEWSPDGKRLVFTCQGDIYITDPNGHGLINLTGGLVDDPEDGFTYDPVDEKPTWSSNVDQIAFISDRVPNRHFIGDDVNSCRDALTTFSTNAIYTINSDGSNLKRITTQDDILIFWYQWIRRP